MLDRVRAFIDRTPLLKKPHVFLKLAARRWTRDERLRERAAASGAFAFIALFAVASVDYLVTGGPDWNPSGEAQAAELPYAPPPIVVIQRAPEPVVAPPPMIEAAAVELPDWTVATEELLGGPDTVFANAPAEFENASYGDDGAAPVSSGGGFVNVVALAPDQPRVKAKR